jgi:hypothetical protein
MADVGTADLEAADLEAADLGVDLAHVLRALEAAAAADVSALGERELAVAVLQLERARRFLDAASCHVLAELDDRRTTDRCFGLRTSPWLAHRAKIPGGKAKHRLATAKRLRSSLPIVDDHLSSGRIGFDHASAFADLTNDRNAEAVAAMSDQLCRDAEHTSFHAWRAELADLANAFDLDGGHDPASDLARNKLHLSPSDDLTLIRGELAGERGLVTTEVLNAIADELFEQFSRDHRACPELEIPDRATLMALALEEACRRAMAVDLSSTKAPRVDAMLVLTPEQLGSWQWGDATTGEDGLVVPSRLHAVDDVIGRPGLCLRRTRLGLVVTDSSGSPVAPSARDVLLCDPDLHTLVVDSLGVPLDAGHTIRFANPAQRRALAHRDGGCVFPGCTAPPSWTDAHHVQRWPLGKTDVRNLLSLCRHHHGVAHRRGWSVELTDDGWSIWTSALGDTFWGQRHQRQRAGPIPAAA